MDAIPHSAPFPICSSLSLETGEELPGTAPHAGVFLLLEYNGMWGAKALEGSDIPPAVKTWLNEQVKRIPHAKLLLIKSRRGLDAPSISFYLAAARAVHPVLHTFHLGSYDDLLDLDIDSLLAGGQAPGEQIFDNSLFLVCTNGKRDACCARYGNKVYQELLQTVRPELGEAVWQCTHVGGHRFAANLLCLPSGLLYGRIRPQDVAPLLENHRLGQISSLHYRGRSCYPEPAQAAEHWLLEQAPPDSGPPDNRLVEIQETGPDRWRVWFVATGGSLQELEVVREVTGIEIYESCPKGNPPQPGKLSFLSRYRVSACPH